MSQFNNSFICPNLIRLWTGQTPCQWSTTSWQSSSERGTAVSQEWFQVAGQRVSVKVSTVTANFISIEYSDYPFIHFLYSLFCLGLRAAVPYLQLC